MRNTFFLIFIFTFFGFSISGCTTQQELTVKNPWVRPGIRGNNSAVYFQIENSTSDNDRLVSTESDIADLVEIHQSRMDANGAMTMEHQSEVIIPAGSEVVFEPGGFHVMLIGLKRDIVPDDTISLTLVFENAGTLTLPVTAREP